MVTWVLSDNTPESTGCPTVQSYSDTTWSQQPTQSHKTSLASDANQSSMLHILKNVGKALAGVAQWIECQPVNQRASSSIPSQGTCLGCGPGPQ